MGGIFFFIGAWLMVSGAKDIRESKKIRDTYEEQACETEAVIDGGAVA